MGPKTRNRGSVRALIRRNRPLLDLKADKPLGFSHNNRACVEFEGLENVMARVGRVRLGQGPGLKTNNAQSDAELRPKSLETVTGQIRRARPVLGLGLKVRKYLGPGQRTRLRPSSEPNILGLLSPRSEKSACAGIRPKTLEAVGMQTRAKPVGLWPETLETVGVQAGRDRLVLSYGLKIEKTHKRSH